MPRLSFGLLYLPPTSFPPYHFPLNYQVLTFPSQVLSCSRSRLRKNTYFSKGHLLVRLIPSLMSCEHVFPICVLLCTACYWLETAISNPYSQTACVYPIPRLSAVRLLLYIAQQSRATSPAGLLINRIHSLTHSYTGLNVASSTDRQSIRALA